MSIKLADAHEPTLLDLVHEASGDARANLAIQPAANAGSFKLKKSAVKLVGAAGPVPATLSRPAATTPVALSPVPGSVKAQPKAVEGYVLIHNNQ